ncbi:GtrA family protein [Smaragdicoccus niigatensis]|uniref:GtrA family protein n=1 Tax=Smaragdicoccus niigatensis TaxID=359359 RepID=UPI000368D9C4|nr:GtrA family protein [Smaragdicoccus niigatensis]
MTPSAWRIESLADRKNDAMILTEVPTINWAAPTRFVPGRIDIRGDHWAAQLTRFAVTGGLSNVLYFAVFVLLTDDGTQVANVAAVVASTIAANELHRRVSFHASDRVHWLTAQVEGGGVALVGLGISAAAIALLQMSVPAISAAVLALITIALSGVIGGMRFVALRGWVFSPARTA